MKAENVAGEGNNERVKELGTDDVITLGHEKE